MCLNLSLFLPVYVSHLVVCSSIDTPLEWFDPWTIFYHFLLYIREPEYIQSCIYIGCPLPSHIHTLLFFEWSRTSSLLVDFLMWEVVGWVVSVVGSSWVLMLSIDCFFCDQRPLFH